MRVSVRAAAAALMAFALSVSAYAAGPKTYPSEDAATKACKSEVVWLNTNSGIFHVKGTKNYGTTKDGAWVCRAAAEKAGKKPAKNEQ